MDVSKIKAALATAQSELNTVTDEEFKARRLKGLRPLTLAAGAIELAVKHVSTAADRTAEPPAQAGGEASKSTPAKKAAAGK